MDRHGELTVGWKGLATATATLLGLSLALPGVGRGEETFTLSLDRDRAFPPAALVSTENPSSSAILRHELNASVDPEKGWIRATDRIFILHASGTDGSEPVPLMLWKDLQLVDVRGDGVEVGFEEPERFRAKSFWKRPPYAELGGYEVARQIDLHLRAPGAEAVWPDTTVVTLTYEGAIVDSLHPPKAAYARSFDTTAGLILPEGAFLAYSSFWIPTRPAEVFTFDLTVTTPAEWRTVSQGRMAKDVKQGTDRVMRWDCPHPMEEIYLVAGPYEENHLRHGDVMAQTFTYADTDSSIYNRYLRGTGAYLDLYEAKVGPYPFAKFALVENFWQSGFGMPSFTLLGNRVIRLPFILDTSYGHEILHNWWGNGVFVDRSEGNWCEGLTTYGADYFYEERKGEEEAMRYRLTALQNYRDYVSDAEDIPLASFRERHDFTTQAVGYSKSMMVIHQLRRAVGDTAFDHGLQRFYRDHLWKAATWSQLFSSVAAASKEDGGPSIDPERWRSQWIERSGAPVLSMENVTVDGGTGHRQVRFDLVQEPMDGGSPYSLLVPVRILGSDDHQVDREVSVKDARTQVSIPCGFEPEIASVDPDFQVLRRLHREEIPTRLSQVLGADSVAIVIADGLDESVASACEELAVEWAKGQRAGVFREGEVKLPTGEGTGDVGFWFLGRGSAADRAVTESHLPGDVAGSGGSGPTGGASSVVLTGSLGGFPWGLIDARSADDVAALGSKVPHYGKYSYLVFEEGSVQDKGVWPAGDSPLRKRFGSD